MSSYAENDIELNHNYTKYLLFFEVESIRWKFVRFSSVTTMCY